MRKRMIYGLLAAVTVFGAVAASAASLGGITTDTLGADNAAVSACDTDGVTTAYTEAYEAAVPGYEVGTVTVGSIADACNGLTMKVNLVDSANASLAESSITVAVDSTATTPDTSDDFDFTASNVSVTSVENVHVTVAG